jgi:hypothetical protein
MCLVLLPAPAFRKAMVDLTGLVEGGRRSMWVSAAHRRTQHIKGLSP